MQPNHQQTTEAF